MHWLIPITMCKGLGTMRWNGIGKRSGLKGLGSQCSCPALTDSLEARPYRQGLFDECPAWSVIADKNLRSPTKNTRALISEN
jgi:hypothetical protein